jgi:glycerol uptake facilitator-like aquaporin
MVRLVLLGIKSKIMFTTKTEITILLSKEPQSIILLMNLFIWKLKLIVVIYKILKNTSSHLRDKIVIGFIFIKKLKLWSVLLFLILN